LKVTTPDPAEDSAKLDFPISIDDTIILEIKKKGEQTEITALGDEETH